MAVLNHQYK